MEDINEKSKEFQKKSEKIKERLNSTFIDGESGNGLVVVTITANREIKNIAIDNSILNDKGKLENYLILALNSALTKAAAINDK